MKMMMEMEGEREREGGMKIITGRGPRRCFATSDRIHQEFASEIWLALAPALSAVSRDKMLQPACVGPCIL